MNSEIIRIEKIEKHYEKVSALKELSLTFYSGKFYAIMGVSGSGKTTLINILGLLDNPTAGNYYLFQEDTKSLDQRQKSLIRNKKIGFIFQSFYLLSHMTAVENVMLPMYLDEAMTLEQMQEKAIQMLSKLGLKERTDHYPKELSAGEQQRVAIARALANDPDIIIADEPTGNLDEKNEETIFKILKAIVKEGKTVITVSHNKEILKYADELVYLDQGRLGERDA
ncbi:ABC transporter ATP-binding protein [Fusibacter sp. 3D3]|uniref:ABC transporter ATP-binding protein n=1 Tax=Fusibacter sp. 3D3 TaxID=1048380 RepID=UPI000852DA87|nr:ABC transporter ATP-binding protein [Fusibacter sp. 3D3]GAU79991.1 cell division transporter, ATP-binding protein FtsE [Fusibacter sp. 3D3]